MYPTYHNHKKRKAREQLSEIENVNEKFRETKCIKCNTQETLQKIKMIYFDLKQEEDVKIIKFLV